MFFSIVSRTSYNINEFGVSVGLHTGVRLLSLGHLLAYSMILIALLVLFVLTVQFRILTINVNKYVALMITMLILTILFYLTLQKNLVVTPINDRNYFVHQPNLFEVINPLAYMRTLDVVEGTVPFTFFGGITVLSSFSLIVSLVSNWFLKKQRYY